MANGLSKTTIREIVYGTTTDMTKITIERETRTIRLTDADYAELMRRGVDRLRKWLNRPDRAKVKE